jgi:dehydrogenase/reductase SDR family member 1
MVSDRLPVDASTDLSGKVALVTGASRGIGRATAVELGARGAKVYVTARSVEAPAPGMVGTLSETVAEVDAAGGTGVALGCDHADDDQVAAVIDQIADAEGGLDVLVNNVLPSPDTVSAAGPGQGGSPFWQTPVDVWDALFTVAVRGHYVCTQKAMPLLLKRDGLIVNISSAGAVKYFFSPLYGAGKAAGYRIMLDMAHELKDTAVSVMSIWPGIVRTELTGALFEQNPMMLTTFFREAWAGFPDIEERLASLGPQDMVALTESPHFAGRAVAALAADPAVGKKSGRALAVVNLADEYGFDDVDGRRPDSFRFREGALWPALT